MEDDQDKVSKIPKYKNKEKIMKVIMSERYFYLKKGIDKLNKRQSGSKPPELYPFRNKKSGDKK